MSMYKTSPAFSMTSTSRKVFVNEHDYSPGPAYNTYGLNKKSKSLSYGIGISKRSQINHGVENNPGPTQYNPENVKKSIKIAFSKSPRKQRLQADLPDPGYYSPFYNEGQVVGKTFQIGSKYPSIMDDVKNTPGPGAYEINSSRSMSLGNDSRVKKPISIFNTTATRFSNNKQSPGPGDYNLLSNNPMISADNKGKFKQSERYQTVKQVTPGPGYYDPSVIQQALSSKLAITMKGKPKKNVFQYQSHCTEYAFLTHNVTESMKYVKQKVLSYKIANSKRRVFEGNQIPSSQNYFKENIETKTPIMIKFASSKRDEKVLNENPGPGEYNPHFSKTISFSMKKNQLNKLFDTSLNPGVGKYDINTVQKHIKGIEFPTSNRTNFISKNITGVGDYEITSRVRSSITIPKSERFREKTSSPGPGDYTIPSSIGNISSISKLKRT